MKKLPEEKTRQRALGTKNMELPCSQVITLL